MIHQPHLPGHGITCRTASRWCMDTSATREEEEEEEEGGGPLGTSISGHHFISVSTSLSGAQAGPARLVVSSSRRW